MLRFASQNVCGPQAGLQYIHTVHVTGGALAHALTAIVAMWH